MRIVWRMPLVIHLATIHTGPLNKNVKSHTRRLIKTTRFITLNKFIKRPDNLSSISFDVVKSIAVRRKLFSDGDFIKLSKLYCFFTI